MNRSPNTTIGALVADDARRARVFERLGIDYCCGGRQSLAEACAERGLDAATVLQLLDAVTAASDAPAATNWQTAPLNELAEHIKATHHAYLRRELPRLEQLLDKVVRAHGAATPWIASVKDVFDALAHDLRQHMEKEEQVVFPYIQALTEGTSPSAPAVLGEDPIHLMEEEHDDAGAALQRIRELTRDFTPPEGACNSFRVTLDGLRELEADMHQHVHKENNILFPRARALA